LSALGRPSAAAESASSSSCKSSSSNSRHRLSHTMCDKHHHSSNAAQLSKAAGAAATWMVWPACFFPSRHKHRAYCSYHDPFLQLPRCRANLVSTSMAMRGDQKGTCSITQLPCALPVLFPSCNRPSQAQIYPLPCAESSGTQTGPVTA
jgi:hypothetical protein